MASGVSTYRPLGIRIAAVSAGIALAVIGLVVAVALPAGVRTTFTPEQVATIALSVVAAGAVLYGLARSSVRTDEDGLVVVNGYRTHRVSWAEAASVGLGRGAPWAVLETSDGNSVMLMAVQNVDGDRARAALAALRRDISGHRH